MKVILDMAISLNGLVAREDGQEDWLPYDGWVEFIEEAKKHGNIIMGRESYTKVTELYKDHNFDDVPVPHKVIITRNASFEAPAGYVVVGSPRAAIDYIKSKGLDTAYLIGGGVINSAFLKEKLVTDIQLTVNPFILGKGRPFIAPGDFENQLTLQQWQPLSNGRMRLVYSVNSDSTL